jgi:MFS transporter, PPP family, 3-phenylpropionic acid transporter
LLILAGEADCPAKRLGGCFEWLDEHMNLKKHVKNRSLEGDPARNFKVRYLQFAGLEFLFWFAICAGNYLPVFLQDEMGYGATMVGIVTAVCSFVGIIATLFWGTFSDRIHSVRKVFMLCIGVGVFLWAMVPLTRPVVFGSFSLCLVFIAAATFFRNPSMALMDNWAVTVSNREGMNYGLIRSVGSFSFAIMGLGLGFVLQKTGVNASFYISALVTIPLIILCLFVKGDTQKTKAIPFRELKIGRLFNYRYITFLIFTVLLNMPSFIMMTFLTFLIKDVHGDIKMVGTILGYKALLEIPMLLLVRPLMQKHKLPYPVMMIGAGILYALEAVLFSQAHSFAQLVIISSLHGLGGGLFIGSASNYCFTIAPDDLKATAQTIYGAVTTMAMIVGSFFGGILTDLMGVRAFILCLAGAIVFSILFYLASQWYGRKTGKLIRQDT